MNIEINRINDEITKKPSEFVREVNEAYMYHLNEIAENIAKNRH
ncbi:MAG TPA: nucleoside kinase, partial [Ruminococcus sp.]|nr:nucleoside kinase [Ruminococcus sp.]